ncbi:hypothetical protein B0J17DRAFT_663251 [Rhizoctonia solani]|nr:hypothetical protein B0J17DRAFT_663251 [Rhizoctonia solani]
MIALWPSLVLDFRIDSISSLVLIFTALLGAATVLVGYSLMTRRASAPLQQRTRNNASSVTTTNGDQPQSSDTNPNLFALIIGIDKYPNLPLLYGASADAEIMLEFLSSDLGTPADHIVNLQLQNLWNNPKINHGDPILIYYAGHEIWARHIQVIFPFDYAFEVPGSSGSAKINCIPDKTGDNITLIFDSCHSASGTRAGEPGQKTGRDRRYRSADVQFDIPDDIDDDCIGLDNSEASPPETQQRDAQLLFHTDQTSHVHLAACGTHEKAIEENGRGVFTTELLKKIRTTRVDNITYDNLMKFLEIPEDQSPQCYGKHKGRILFNSCVPSSKITFVPVGFDHESDALTLKAGEASGVNSGSIWELHKSPTENSESVGRFKVTKLYGSIAFLQPLDQNISLAEFSDCRLFARYTHLGQQDQMILKVWMSSEVQTLLFPGPDKHTGSTHESGISYKMMSARDEAEVALELYPSQPTEGSTNGLKAEVAFYWCDEISKKYGTEKLGHRKSARREDVEVVLFAAARWRWHLRRTNFNTDQGPTMKMLKVATRASLRAPRVFLKEPEDVLMQDGVVEIEVEGSALYGFVLKNGLRSPLHVRMFYFDSADFSIGDMFGHNTGNGESTPDIPSRGQLVIGNGSDGGTPIRFSISPGNQVELGYMKVFWSTEPLELDYIEQGSAFKMRPGDVRGGSVDQGGSDSKWGTICLPLALRGRV